MWGQYLRNLLEPRNLVILFGYEPFNSFVVCHISLSPHIFEVPFWFVAYNIHMFSGWDAGLTWPTPTCRFGRVGHVGSRLLRVSSGHLSWTRCGLELRLGMPRACCRVMVCWWVGPCPPRWFNLSYPPVIKHGLLDKIGFYRWFYTFKPLCRVYHINHIS
jgi:hypothetical protein